MLAGWRSKRFPYQGYFKRQKTLFRCSPFHTRQRPGYWIGTEANRVWPVNCRPEIGASDSFPKSARKSGCYQAETDVLAQNTAVLRYAAHFILKKRAQKNASFSGISIYVLAHLHLLVIWCQGGRSPSFG